MSPVPGPAVQRVGSGMRHPWVLVLLLSAANSRPLDICDNGKSFLEVDLLSPEAYQCPGPHWPLPDKPASHICMGKPIKYNETIPNSRERARMSPVPGPAVQRVGSGMRHPWVLVLLLSAANSRPLDICDNGKSFLEVDLPSPEAYQCPGPHWPLPDKPASHICMGKPIKYNETIPNRSDQEKAKEGRKEEETGLQVQEGGGGGGEACATESLQQ
ncbi:UNVERIFIED_CONTAM: hypothetical protein FKN15_016579 [Acipenser sinensis]